MDNLKTQTMSLGLGIVDSYWCSLDRRSTHTHIIDRLVQQPYLNACQHRPAIKLIGQSLEPVSCQTDKL